MREKGVGFARDFPMRKGIAGCLQPLNAQLHWD